MGKNCGCSVPYQDIEDFDFKFEPEFELVPVIANATINPVDEGGYVPTDNGWQNAAGQAPNFALGDNDPWCMNPNFPTDVTKQVKCRTLNNTRIRVAPLAKPLSTDPNVNKGYVSAPAPINQLAPSNIPLNQPGVAFHPYQNQPAPQSGGWLSAIENFFGFNTTSEVLAPDYVNDTMWAHQFEPQLTPSYPPGFVAAPQAPLIDPNAPLGSPTNPRRITGGGLY